jgi:ubiquinone/menaquinone biosynthesis C-methylase UbiE
MSSNVQQFNKGWTAMRKVIESRSASRTSGRVLHKAASYDLTVWLMTFGRERAFRERILELARLAPGESALDVGCGTGTLAILAKSRVGPAGSVSAIDASPEMIARARAKAAKARVEIEFNNAVAEALPFPDERFDAVLCTVMLHHLPRKARQQALQQIRRVLKPAGRLLVVDFNQGTRGSKGLFAHFLPFRGRHGFVNGSELIGLINECGFNVTDSGDLRYRNMYYLRAEASSRA